MDTRTGQMRPAWVILCILSAMPAANGQTKNCAWNVTWESVGPCPCSGHQLQQKKVMNDICDPVNGYRAEKSWFDRVGYTPCFNTMMWMIAPEGWDATWRHDAVRGYRSRGFDPYTRSLCRAHRYLVEWGPGGDQACPALDATFGYPWKWPWQHPTADCTPQQQLVSCDRKQPCGAAAVGINYSPAYMNEARAPKTFKAMDVLAKAGLRKIKVFDFNSPRVNDVASYLYSHLKGGEDLTISIPNNMLGPVIEGFVNPAAVAVKYPDVVTTIAIGHDPFSRENYEHVAHLMGSACEAVHRALKIHGLEDKVKVTVPFSGDILGFWTQPSHAYIKPDNLAQMKGCLDIMQEQKSPFVVNINSYLSYLENEATSLDFAIAKATWHEKPCYQDNFLVYCNLFDAMYDAFRFALDKEGYKDMPIVVGAAGWPTDGGAAGPHSKPGADRKSACHYTNSMLRSVMEDLTPRMRELQSLGSWQGQEVLDVYLFEAFDESLRVPNTPYEQHWGLWSEGGDTVKFLVDWSGSHGFEKVCDTMASEPSSTSEVLI